MRWTLVGFTGTSKVANPTAWVLPELEKLNPATDALVVGGAEGVDITVARLGWTMGFQVHAVLPAAPYHPEAERYARTVRRAPEGKSLSESYMLRNDLLVAVSDRMIAFPRTATRALRSGTWATVRRAEAVGKDVKIVPLVG